MKIFNIPDRFYRDDSKKPEQSSTAASCFDSASAISSQAWLCTVPPEREREKKHLVLSDWTLAQGSADLIYVLQLLKELMLNDNPADNFDIYIPTADGLIKIGCSDLNINLFESIKPMHAKNIRKLMLSKYKVSGDEVLIIDHVVMQEICGHDNSLLEVSDKPQTDFLNGMDRNFDETFPILPHGISVDLDPHSILQLKRLPEEQITKITNVNLVRMDIDYNSLGLLEMFPNLQSISGMFLILLKFKQQVKDDAPYEQLEYRVTSLGLEKEFDDKSVGLSSLYQSKEKLLEAYRQLKEQGMSLQYLTSFEICDDFCNLIQEYYCPIFREILFRSQNVKKISTSCLPLIVGGYYDKIPVEHLIFIKLPAVTDALSLLEPAPNLLTLHICFDSLHGNHISNDYTESILQAIASASSSMKKIKKLILSGKSRHYPEGKLSGLRNGIPSLEEIIVIDGEKEPRLTSYNLRYNQVVKGSPNCIKIVPYQDISGNSTNFHQDLKTLVLAEYYSGGTLDSSYDQCLSQINLEQTRELKFCISQHIDSYALIYFLKRTSINRLELSVGNVESHSMIDLDFSGCNLDQLTEIELRIAEQDDGVQQRILKDCEDLFKGSRHIKKATICCSSSYAGDSLFSTFFSEQKELKCIQLDMPKTKAIYHDFQLFCERNPNLKKMHLNLSLTETGDDMPCDVKLEQLTEIIYDSTKINEARLLSCTPNCIVTRDLHRDVINTRDVRGIRDDRNVVREEVRPLGTTCGRQSHFSGILTSRAKDQPHPLGMLAGNADGAGVPYSSLDCSTTYKEGKQVNPDVGAIMPLTAESAEFAKSNIYESRDQVYDVYAIDKSIARLNVIKTYKRFTVPIEIRAYCVSEQEGLLDRQIKIAESLDDQYCYSAVKHGAFDVEKRYPLHSLDPSDKPLDINIVVHKHDASQIFPNAKVEACEEDSKYYIIIYGKELSYEVTITTTIGVAKQQSGEAVDFIDNQPLKGLIEHIKSFPSPAATDEDQALTGITSNSSAEEILEAMYAQKKGSCRHRAAVFLHVFTQLQQRGEIPLEIKARGVNGPTHGQVEIKIRGTWRKQNLGGYVVPVNATRVELQPRLQQKLVKIQKKGRQEQKNRLSCIKTLQPDSPQQRPYSNLDDFLAELKSFIDAINITNITNSRAKILIKAGSLEQLNNLRNLLLWQSILTQDSDYFAVDRFSDLQVSNSTMLVAGEFNQGPWKVNKPPSGALYDFLHNQRRTPKVLLIDWSQLQASQMVKVNSLLDDKAQVDGQDIYYDTSVIGLVAPPQKPDDPNFSEDDSFVSRHNKLLVFPKELNKELEDRLTIIKASFRTSMDVDVDDVEDKIEVNLYHSPNWRSMLIGKCKLSGKEQVFIPGPLVTALKDSRPLKIINGPFQDIQFNRFIADLEVTGRLQIYGRVLQATPLAVERVIASYDFAVKIQGIVAAFFEQATTTSVPENVLTLNSAVFERCLVNEYVDEHGQLIVMDGWLESHRNSSCCNQPLNLFITHELSIHQWALLLDTAKKLNIQLALYIAEGLEVPFIVAATDAQASQGSATTSDSAGKHFSYYESDDLELGIIELSSKYNLTYHADASELSDQGVLFGNDCRLTDEQFTFTEQVSAIWKELIKGGTVLLTGKFSTELLGHLSSLMLDKPYLYHQGQKETFAGKLILLAEPQAKNIKFIANKLQANSIRKEEAVKKLLTVLNFTGSVSDLFADYNEEFCDELFSLPFAKIRQIVSFANAYRKQHKLAIPFASALDCRYRGLFSYDWHKESSLDLSYESYQQFEEQREQAVSFMLSWSPYVFLESQAGAGKSSFIKEYATINKHRILFDYKNISSWATAPADDNYELILFIDEANLQNTNWSMFNGLFSARPSIFLDGQYYSLTNNHKVIFAGNPLNYGGDRKQQRLFVERPAIFEFPMMSPAYIYHKILKPILAVCFSDEQEQKQEKISRDIFGKYELSHFQDPEKHGVTARDLQWDALKCCAITAQEQVASSANSSSSSNVSNTRNSTSYVLTESRREAAATIEDLLRVRQFRRNVQAHNSQAAKSILYGGKSALLLNGPPGIGKTQLIKYILQNYGFVSASLDNLDNLPSGRDSNIYYDIPASLNQSIKDRVLRHAFEQGAIVLMDEINVHEELEATLNSYLMGDEINKGCQINAGFTVMASYNDASLRGRRKLGPALESRGVLLSLPEYPQDELVQVLQSLAPNVSDSLVNDLVDVFVEDVNAAKRNPSLMKPTFRDLQEKFLQEVAKLQPVVQSPEEDTSSGCMLIFSALRRKYDQLVHSFSGLSLDSGRPTP